LFSSELQTIQGRVISKRTKQGSIPIFEIVLSDGSGLLRAKWFNQPYMDKRFRIGDEVVLSGQVKPAYIGGGLEMDNPEYEVISGDKDLIHTSKIVPIYRAIGRINSRQLRAMIYEALKDVQSIDDPLPKEILSQLGLLPLRDALRVIHFPEDLEGNLARKRLIFDECLMLEIGLHIIKKNRILKKGLAHSAKGILIKRLKEALPYRLTRAQESALSDIISDMKSPYPMNRLLQGDVGSGKTIVALMAMVFSVESEYQCCLMAPTEILAEQHYLNIKNLVGTLGISTALITSNSKERPMKELSEGKIDIVIGTHALLEERVKFSRLGLIVIDEQHRFGVMQRANLREKGTNPDVLIMTATPIPRTLALTLYGDLDVSTISELPPGRTEVETILMSSDEKKKIYSMIAQEVRSRGQVYVVYPVIEGDEGSSLKSAILGYDAMKKVFPTLRVSIVHGKMRPEERERTMVDFKRGVIDILISTTVIEVGLDVPNASLMVIVHAERFGLAQLHQLRGRVGRGRRRSRCVLLSYGKLTKEAEDRLGAMVSTTDGFKIAEIDLSIRGPGEFMGTRQSGLPDLKMADLVRDKDLFELARQLSEDLLERDPTLNYPALRAEVEGFWRGKVELFRTA